MTKTPSFLKLINSTYRRYWRITIASFVGWSLLAAIPVTSSYLIAGAPGFELWWALFTKIGLYYYLWGLTAPLLYILTDSLPYRGKGLLWAIPLHLSTLAALSFSFGFIVHQNAWQDWLFGVQAPGYHAMSFFTYSLIVLCSLAIKFYRLSLFRQRQATDARIHAAQLDNQLNLARVDSLLMQMNPHFLFNALNSIGALIDAEQNDRAYEALEMLGELLRSSLSLSKEHEVSLEQEVRFGKAYLAMEQIRFADRLNVTWELENSALAIQVPAFVLQPCLENSIKHAVSRSTRTVTIKVSAHIDNCSLNVAIADNGRSVEQPSGSIGMGITNLRERLRLRYGHHAQVESGRFEQGYRTVIRIPISHFNSLSS